MPLKRRRARRPRRSRSEREVGCGLTFLDRQRMTSFAGLPFAQANRRAPAWAGVSPHRPVGYPATMARRGGWRRLGRRRFRYVDSRGRAIGDEESLARIRSLAIPPAWENVWISPTAGADLQATGIDSAGRKQYLYSERRRAARQREKFDRLLHFARRLPTLRASAENDLRAGRTSRNGRARSRSAWSTRRGSESGPTGTRAPRARTASQPCGSVTSKWTETRSTLSSGRRTTRSSAARCGAFPSHGSWSTWLRWTDHGCSGSNGTESSSRSPRTASTTTSGSGSRPFHREGLPHLGRDARRGERARTARPGAERARREAGAGARDAQGRPRAREHRGRRARVIREPGRRRRVPRGARRSRTTAGPRAPPPHGCLSTNARFSGFSGAASRGD